MKNFCIFCIRECIYYASIAFIIIYSYVVYYNYNEDKAIVNGYDNVYYQIYNNLRKCSYEEKYELKKLISYNAGEIRYNVDKGELCKY